MSLVCLEMKKAPCGLSEVGRGWILQELVDRGGGEGGYLDSECPEGGIQELLVRR